MHHFIVADRRVKFKQKYDFKSPVRWGKCFPTGQVDKIMAMVLVNGYLL